MWSFTIFASVEDFLELKYLQSVLELHLLGRWAALRRRRDRDLSQSRSLEAGPLRQQSQSLLVIHGLPRDKFLGKHIHSAKER